MSKIIFYGLLLITSWSVGHNGKVNRKKFTIFKHSKFCNIIGSLIFQFQRHYSNKKKGGNNIFLTKGYLGNDDTESDHL